MDLLHAGVPIIAGVDSPLVPYGVSLHTEIAATSRRASRRSRR